MKKQFACVLAAVMAASMVTGCGGQTATGGPDGAGGAADGGAGKQVLRMAHYIETENQEKPYDMGMGEILKRFTADTGIEIQLEQIPWDQLDAKLVITNQSGEPSGDIFALSSQKLASIVNAGALLALDDRIEASFNKEDFNPAVWSNCTYPGDGKIYAMLQSVHTRGIWYNKDLVSTVPTTWDEMIEIGQQISKPEEGLYAFGFWGGKHYGSVELTVGPMAWSGGGKLANDDGSAAWNNQAVADAAKFMSDCVNEYKISPESCFSTKDYNDIAESFRAGNIAMYYDGSYAYSKNFVESELGKAGKLGFAPYLAKTKGGSAPHFSNGWAWGIPQKSKQPDLAWKFVEWFETEDVQIEHSLLEGGLPTLTSAYENEQFQAYPFPEFIDNLTQNGHAMDPFVYYQEGQEAISVAVGTYCLDPTADINKLLEDSAKTFDQKYYS